MPSETIYNWHKLNEDEYSRTLYTGEKERVFLLRKGDVGVLGMGKGFYLLTKLKSESKFQNVTCIVYQTDNHSLLLHDEVRKHFDAKQVVAGMMSEKDLSHLMFEIADKYVHSLY